MWEVPGSPRMRSHRQEEMQSQHSQLLWSLRSASHTTSQVTIATATSMVGFPSGGLPSEDDVEGPLAFVFC